MIDTIPILLISNLDLYISGKKILRSLNLEIFDKEITIIMGPSGTGKSTLLRTLAGLNYDNPQIEISGHTDAVGADADNLTLSNSRANAVMNYLLAKGIAKDRLTAKGYGETKFIAPNTTEEGKQLNRRVEFVILEK